MNLVFHCSAFNMYFANMQWPFIFVSFALLHTLCSGCKIYTAILYICVCVSFSPLVVIVVVLPIAGATIYNTTTTAVAIRSQALPNALFGSEFEVFMFNTQESLNLSNIYKYMYCCLPFRKIFCVKLA